MSFLSEKALFFWDWRWLTTALVFLLSYLVVRFYHKVSKYPKGPFPLPVVGNLLELRNTKELYKAANNWSQKFGDPITLWMGEKPMVVLNTHKLVKEAFIERRHEFAGRFSTKMAELQRQGNHNIMFEDYNPTWKTLRKLALTAVRKYAVSDSLENLCCEVVDAYVDSLKEGPNVVDSRAPFMYMLYNIIGMSVYGAKFDKESPELTKMQAINKIFFELAPNGLPSDIVPWLGLLYRGREKKIEILFKEFLDKLDSLYKRAVKSYVPGKIENFTHSMLAARDEAIEQEKNDAQYLTEANMVQIIMDIFGAATDTSLGELQWLCLTMTRKPEIQERIKEEIERNLGQARPGMQDRGKLHYTVACLLETLRMYPIVPLGLPHNTTCDTEVGGQFIPKDTGIFYNIYTMNRDPQLWPEPEVFRPERFLDPVTGKVNQELLPQLMSFGLGPRTCPGEKLAHVDMFYVLVRFMQRVSCSAPAGKSDTPIAAINSNLFLTPAEQDIVLTRVY
ncbi:cytochrome P450 1A1 [Ixodes scapularis]|uniref:cytochrome P450 1A1 n=1 Tax=Ixodes scapularis TaxID=6945 RepID=UPI001A9F568A|nr:cytochrome P450 1A1 [Ixodes scapularis]